MPVGAYATAMQHIRSDEATYDIISQARSICEQLVAQARAGPTSAQDVKFRIHTLSILLRNVSVNWIYLSPHFDDVAFSCGGLVWEQAQRGDRVEIWTICAGDPPPRAISPFAESLHKRWQTSHEAPAQRREEDLASCAAMEASAVYFPFPDSIYRRSETENAPLYPSEEAIFGSLHPLDASTVEHLSGELKRRLPEDVELVCPMTIGGHVDHRLVRAGAERLGRRLWYYAEVPYVLKHPDDLSKIIQDSWIRQVFPISDAGLTAWKNAVAAHASQISSFWQNLEAMRTVISSYCRENYGIQLWRTSE